MRLLVGDLRKKTRYVLRKYITIHFKHLLDIILDLFYILFFRHDDMIKTNNMYPRFLNEPAILGK